MTNKAIGRRLLSRATKIPVHRFQNATLSHEELHRVKEAANRLANLGLSFWSPPSLTIEAVESMACYRRAKGDLDLLIVDYLGLLGTLNRFQSPYERVTHLSNRLMQLAKKIDCPVIALSQLNRDSEKGGSGKMREPTLAELRDSGAIEQDAHVVILLHREERDSEKITCNIAKCRDRPIGSIDLAFDGSSMTFSDPQTKYTSDFATHN